MECLPKKPRHKHKSTSFPASHCSKMASEELTPLYFLVTCVEERVDLSGCPKLRQQRHPGGQEVRLDHQNQGETHDLASPCTEGTDTEDTLLQWRFGDGREQGLCSLGCGCGVQGRQVQQLMMPGHGAAGLFLSTDVHTSYNMRVSSSPRPLSCVEPNTLHVPDQLLGCIPNPENTLSVLKDGFHKN